MASLVVLEHHLWVTLTEIKDADRVSFLDAPISPSGLFGPAVEGFAERFTEAQKVSQAMQHFPPKRSSPAAAQSPQDCADSAACETCTYRFRPSAC